MLLRFIYDKFINVSKNKFLFLNSILQPLTTMNTAFLILQRQKSMSYTSVNKKPYLFVIPWSKPTHFLNPSGCSLL